jgi:lysylphosphatidylglycerol synthetase-like protein (DUF2156 family)
MRFGTISVAIPLSGWAYDGLVARGIASACQGIISNDKMVFVLLPPALILVSLLMAGWIYQLRKLHGSLLLVLCAASMLFLPLHLASINNLAQGQFWNLMPNS